MVKIILICFKNLSKLKNFDKKLNVESIEYDEQSNDNWVNYRFNEISYYIKYSDLKKVFFVKQYIKLHKNFFFDYATQENTLFIELKSRRCGFNEYNVTMLNILKLNKC